MAELAEVLGGGIQPINAVLGAQDQINPGSIPSDLELIGGGASASQQSEVYNCSFYSQYPDTFSPKQTVDLGPQMLQMEREDGSPCVNANQWKALVPCTTNEGLLYEDNDLAVECKI